MAPILAYSRGRSRWCTFVSASLVVGTAGVFAVAECAAAARWIQTSGPGGGAIDVVVGGGAWTFAGNSGLLFRSGNGGLSWTAVPGLPAGRAVTPGAVLGDAVIATVENPWELFVSIDAGSTWASTPLIEADLESLEVQQLDGLVAATLDPAGADPPRLFVTADAAEWTEVPLPVTSGSIFGHGGAIYIATFGTMYRTVDLGAAWTELPALPDNDVFLIVGSTSSAIIIRGGFSGSWRRSFDGAASWPSFAPSGLPGNGITSRAAIGDTLFIVSGQQAYRSVDDGSTWTQLASPDLPVSLAGTWAAASDLFVTPVSEGGLWRSTDAGASWEFASEGLNSATIGALGSVSDVLLASPLYGMSHHRSADAGASWHLVPGLAGQSVNVYLALDEDSVLAGTSSGGVFRSDDSGLSWQPVNNGLPLVSPGAIEPINALTRIGDAIFAGTGGAFVFIADGSHCACSGTTSGDGVYRTTNGGASWQRVSTGLPINTFDLGTPILRPIISLAARGQTLLAATSLHGVWRSTNLGASWSPTGGLPPGGSTPLVPVHELISTDEAFFLVAQSTAAGGPLYRSDNDGATWSAVPSNLQASAGDFSNAAVLGGNFYISGDLLSGGMTGAYRSSDEGATWSPAGTALAELVVSDLAVAADTLVAAPVGHGVWRLDGADGSPADVNGDGVIDVDDLVAVIVAWGGCSGCPEDTNGDGTVDVDDLVAVLLAWS